MKKISWQGTSRDDLLTFPKKAQRRIGFELYSVQLGLEPSDWKTMKTIGKGVKEIRVRQDNQYRVIYLSQVNAIIHVLHAFVKKTQKTSKKDIEIAKNRYQALLNMGDQQ